MQLTIKVIFALLFAAQTFVSPAFGADEELIKKLVQEELERLLNTEGTLDTAIEKGIENFILKQRAAEQESKQQQQTLTQNLRAVDPRNDHILGDLDAPITLLEYSDFECPFCKRFHPTVVELMKNNPGKIRWVYRHFPLPFHNPGAQKQAEASECVAELNGNDAFWKYSDLIYLRTKAGGKGFPLEKLRPLAEEIGVDGAAFDKCLDSGQMTARVKQDHENGVKSGVSGTPASFLINQDGKIYVAKGAYSIEQLQSVVDRLLN